MLFSCAVAFFTAFTISAVNYYRVLELTRAKEIASLKSSAELVVPYVVGAHELLAHDTLMVLHTPPFQGIARSMANNGIDPEDGSTQTLWFKRLETIFTSLMKLRKSYVQMRFIGVADGGRELVRVDRRDGSLVTVPRDLLQRKSQHAYFQRGAATRDGEVYFSDVTLNIDRGVVQADLPVIRAVSPVYGPDGKLFGMIAVNVHYGELLKSILRKISPGYETYIMNATGDFISMSPGGEISELHHRGSNKGAVPPVIEALRESDQQSATLFKTIDGQNYIIQQAVFSPDPNRPLHTKIGLVVAESELLAAARASRLETLLFGLLLVIIASLVSIMFARIFTNPLRDLVEDIRNFGAGIPRQIRHALGNDEVGEVSRAFHNLAEKLTATQASMTETLERLTTLREHMVDAVVTTDRHGLILEFNRSAEMLFCCTAEKATGKNVKMFIPSGDGTPDKVSTDSDRTGDVRIVDAVTSAGKTFPVELRVSPIELNGETVFNSVIRDVSERIAMEKVISVRTSELERSNRDLDDFAYIASHDLKEPLRGISNHVQFLREDYEQILDEPGQRRIERIQSLCSHADNLTSDLLEWSRLGRQEIVLLALDPSEIVEGIRDSLSDLMTESNAEIRTVGPLPTMRGDLARITSLFYNLVLNGIKYNDSPQKIIEIGRIDGEPGPDGKPQDVFYVRDNGIGIEQQFHDKIFMIFKRLNPEKTYGAGTGAGLCFVQKIVEGHNGRIWLESEPGKGSTFFFNLGNADHA